VVWSMRVAVMNVYNPSIIFYNKAIAIFAAWLAVRTRANENPNALQSVIVCPVEE